MSVSKLKQKLQENYRLVSPMNPVAELLIDIWTSNYYQPHIYHSELIPFLCWSSGKKKISSTQDDILKSFPLHYEHGFLSGQKNPFHSLSLLAFSSYYCLSPKFEYMTSFPIGREYKEEGRITEMAKEIHDIWAHHSTTSAVSSFKLSQTVTIQWVRGELYSKSEISTLREYD